MSFIGAFFCFLGKIGTGRMFSFGVDAFFPRWAEGTGQNATLMPERRFFLCFRHRSENGENLSRDAGANKKPQRAMDIKKGEMRF